MIRFQCPTCQKVLKAPDEGTGRKINCPKCGQRLQIPPPIQAQNKTVLGQSLPEPPAPEKLDEPEELIPFAALASPPPTAGEAPPPESATALPPPPGGNLPYSIGTVGCGVLALIALGIGLEMVLYFAVSYDTTVPVYPGVRGLENERVHNVGLMQDRTVGVVIGVGLVLLSAVASLAAIVAVYRALSRQATVLDRANMIMVLGIASIVTGLFSLAPCVCSIFRVIGGGGLTAIWLAFVTIALGVTSHWDLAGMPGEVIPQSVKDQARIGRKCGMIGATFVIPLLLCCGACIFGVVLLQVILAGK